ncbi:MAG: ArsR family transcriptional regulator [Thermoproteota archaeon]|nr:ArsR family transcriptional regulator [Thermoproteota archaeon]
MVTGIDDKKPKAIRDTKWTILNLLLDGSKTAGEIADKLKIQKSAIRNHLESLRAEQAIRSYFKAECLGRPTKVYEITESGREMFPRKYDLLLSLVLQIIEAKEGHEYTKKIITSVADNIAQDIQDKIGDSSTSLEESLRTLNSASNEMGFMSSFYKEEEDGSTYSIVSRNCIAHKVAFSNQDAVCHGFHGRIIQKALEGKISPEVQLKECIALGDNYSRHVITINKNTK